jgi:DNA-binding transcriptional MerR regulator
MSRRTEGTLTVRELGEATQCSAHTIRYYDNEGLIPLVGRNDAGHRRFQPEHASWIRLLKRLRASGMSIDRMRAYARLAASGDETVDDRKAILKDHRDDIRNRIEELQRCLVIVDAKIDLYEGRITDPGIIRAMVDATPDPSGDARNGAAPRS